MWAPYGSLSGLGSIASTLSLKLMQSLAKHQFVSQVIIAVIGRNFCKEISQLKLRRNMWKMDRSRDKILADKLTIHFNMLGALMDHCIHCTVNDTSVVCIEWNGNNKTPNSQSKHRSQTISPVSVTMGID